MESRSNKEERGTALRREHRAAIVVEKRREDITRGGDWSEQGSESESVPLKTLDTLKTLKASAIGVSAHLQVSSEQGRAPQSAPVPRRCRSLGLVVQIIHGRLLRAK